MNDFTGKLRELGPIGNGDGANVGQVQAKLAEVRQLVPYINLTKKEKLAKRLDNEEPASRSAHRNSKLWLR